MSKVKTDESKEVAVTDESKLPAVIVGGASLPAHMIADMNETAGLGNSGDARDNVMPFLGILQKGSPQCDEEEAKYIEGAKPGMIINTATGKLYSEIVVIPCGHQKNFVEWKPNRQGWAGSHPCDIEHIKKLGAKKVKTVVDGKERTNIMLPSGNLLVETAYTLIMVEGCPMVIGAASTALGPMRQWMSYRNSLRLPNRKPMASFFKQYRLTTVRETNDSGSWYNWKFADAGFTAEGDYLDAKMFAIDIAKGNIVIGRPDDFDSPAPSSSRSDDYPEDRGGSYEPGMDDDIPV